MAAKQRRAPISGGMGVLDSESYTLCIPDALEIMERMDLLEGSCYYVLIIWHLLVELEEMDGLNEVTQLFYASGR